MASKIWVILQLRNGTLHPMSREAVVAGQSLAEVTGGTAEAVILGQGAQEASGEASGFDLAAVRVGEGEQFGSYTPGAWVSCLAPAMKAVGVDFALLPHTYQSVDYMARLAYAAGAALLPEVIGFESREGGLVWRRPVLGGKLEAEVRVGGEGPVVLSLQSGAFPAEGVRAGSAPVEALEIDAAAVTTDREILGVEEVAGEHVDLSQAPIIVAVGRGLGGAEKMGVIEELAAALGAEIGASRPVIDGGWLPRDRQIGSSGQTVAPKLYLAVGISGAIQHLVGMKGSQVVVAINKDPSAPIFGVSRYGIVGDLHEVLPPLIAAVKEARA